MIGIEAKQSPKDENQIKYGLIKVVNFTINLFLKVFLKMNNIQMYSTYNEEKSVVAERFIRTLKYRIFKYMPAINQCI